MAYFIIAILLFPGFYFFLAKQCDRNSPSTREKLRQLYAGEDITEKLMLYRREKMTGVLIILTGSLVIAILCELFSGNSTQIEQGQLKRPSYGEESKELTLEVLLEGIRQNKKIQGEITFTVPARQYGQEQIEEMFQKGREHIQKFFLGDNLSADAVEQNLNLMTYIPQTAVTVSWETDGEIIEEDGTLHREEITSAGKEITLYAVMQCQERKENLECKVQILPPKYSEEEKVMSALLQEIEKTVKEKETEDSLQLPKEIPGYILQYKKSKKHTGELMLLFGMVLALLSFSMQDEQIKKKCLYREQQMLLDYPEIINQFTLLLSAGLTMQGAVFKIADEYQNSRENGKEKVRYAYEELCVTASEMKNGVIETEALDHLGKRIKLLPYMKFSALVTQNIRKGSAELLSLLRYEAVEAFAERKEQAKRMGEEAGTRLLFPMMLMLLIVFIIILVPAFMSLSS